MSNHDNNKCTMSTQVTARAVSVLSDNQIKVLSDLIHLLAQPQSDHNTLMIRHFWQTLPDRLTDDEWLFFQSLEAELFSMRGGAS